MPDLITHTLFVYPLKYRYPKAILFLLLGTILPDILGRIPGVIWSGSPVINWYQLAIHTPFNLLLFIYAFSFFFAQKKRKRVFILLTIGTFAHFFLDFFQKTINIGNLWLFPFSFASFQIPLIWPDDTIYLIPVFGAVNLIIFVVNKKMTFWR